MPRLPLGTADRFFLIRYHFLTLNIHVRNSKIILFFSDDEEYNRSHNLNSHTTYAAALALNESKDDLIGSRITFARTLASSSGMATSYHVDSCNAHDSNMYQHQKQPEVDNWMDKLCDELVSDFTASAPIDQIR